MEIEPPQPLELRSQLAWLEDRPWVNTFAGVLIGLLLGITVFLLYYAGDCAPVFVVATPFCILLGVAGFHRLASRGDPDPAALAAAVAGQ
eukprot:CAMPEP_0198520910 /NCGR_PEP_ID=MMETSP1462-20131121/20614_1 /TAXON_ID=1333877 /ORGANISM="Brandtodinium nutriculum, Strain RCC3387" /LENGTH=89 /DNA_ID=CAMNT_0044250541 /DNA_START=36 /DNA_END=302 /DNA_ORIENTATION=+